LKADTIIMRRMPATMYAPHTLVPQDQAGAELLGKIPLGEDVAVKIIRSRSLPQHRKFWAALRYVAEATKWETAERLLAELKLNLGYYDSMKMPSGEVVRVLDSISFPAKTQDEFQDFMQKSLTFICQEILPGYDPDDLLREAEMRA
jgi:LPS O-antigen subunit length determinant protein (WzzB/FepE family)